MFWILKVLLNWISELLLPKSIYKWICILLKTLPRDIRMVINILTIYWELRRHQKKNSTVFNIFKKNVERYPKKVAFYFEDEAWTFEKVEEFSNKIANYFEQQGFKKGDTIAVMLDNCIEYPAIWLGLSKRGIVSALINTNLVKDSLFHSLETAHCKALIFGTSHVKTINELLDNLQSTKLYYYRNDVNEKQEMSMGFIDLTRELVNISDEIEQAKDISSQDPLMYIYTSGTTGLPKAAQVTHLKFISIYEIFKQLSGFNESDVFYVPIPIYHGTGGVLGIGQAIIGAATTVIRKKFSASNYFGDCAKYKVTVAQYVGELCRYVLAVPEDQCKKYQVKTFVGNGLKPQIWKQFVERFNIEHIVEIYGSTEGNMYLANTDGKIGAVGFIPRYLKWAIGATNIKCNEATGEPIRNENGFCSECDVGEPGILISKINIKNSVIKYDGYTDKNASDKKVLQNVFQKGDLYFNSGDILEYDELGYYYFKDRTGDTFRWKGENVSTAEIEGIISNIVYLNDVAVYGVKVPHTEGRAGMAAIVDQNRNLNIGAMARDFKQSLPSYAIPIFIRIMDSVPKTSTLKIKKIELKEEGFNIHIIKDHMYFYHSKFEKYVPLTQDIYEKIEMGSLRI